jgi:hypothetical protein
MRVAIALIGQSIEMRRSNILVSVAAQVVSSAMNNRIFGFSRASCDCAPKPHTNPIPAAIAMNTNLFVIPNRPIR